MAHFQTMARRAGYTLRQTKSGRWQVRIQDGTGAQVGVGTFADKAEAERFGQQQAVEMRGGARIDPRRADVTVADWLARWLEKPALSSRMTAGRPASCGTSTSRSHSETGCIRPTYTLRLGGES